MILVALGSITGTLPAPGSSAMQGRFIDKIRFAPDPSQTAVVLIQHNGNTIAAFNKPAATGALDPHVFVCAPHELNILDPTEYSLSGGSAFVSYEIL